MCSITSSCEKGVIASVLDYRICLRNVPILQYWVFKEDQIASFPLSSESVEVEGRNEEGRDQSLPLLLITGKADMENGAHSCGQVASLRPTSSAVLGTAPPAGSGQNIATPPHPPSEDRRRGWLCLLSLKRREIDRVERGSLPSLLRGKKIKK